MSESSISLSKLLGNVSKTLKGGMPGSQWIMAEIMELHVNQRGHCYLELIEKGPDDGAILARARATIWASKYNMLRPFFEATTGTQLKSGIKLLCKGSVEFHSQYGFSINLSDIDPAYTLGDLARKKQEVIGKLRQEGVMEMNKELPFPAVPQRIAAISSEGAAGYGDFMDSISGNHQGYHIQTQLFQAVMQGDQAPSSIINALDEVYSFVDDFDCVVIIRGGGSKADLECYNDYDLAYYITQFPLPVITGIGHERDESVADMVAFLGLKTPTAVAEYILDQLLAFEFRLSEFREKLSNSVSRAVQQQRMLIERYAVDLTHLSRGSLQREVEKVDRYKLQLGRDTRTLLDRKKEHLAMLETRNALVNPANVLKRGYSITLHNGKALTGTEAIIPGDILETRLHHGTVISKAEKTTSNHGKRKD
jgi:exodeoxyribonuclease VII large subunit